MAIQVTGLGAFLTTLDRAVKIGTDPFAAAKDINPVVKAFQTEEREAFKSEGATQGKRWARLKASTLEHRGPGKILQPTTKTLKGGIRVSKPTRLKDSLTGQTRDTRIQKLNGGRRLQIASNVPYAQYHQKGTSRMQARPPIVATKRLARAVGLALSGRLAARLRGR